MSKTYWNKTGRFQDYYNELWKLIPGSGSLPNPRSKNKCLERLRKASNAAYDLNNNGLCNRAQSFSKIFGVAGLNFRSGWRSFNNRGGYQYFTQDDFNRLNKIIDSKLDYMILDAALEQLLITKDQYDNHIKDLEKFKQIKEYL